MGGGPLAQDVAVQFFGREHTAHRALVPEVPREGAGVYAFHTQDSVRLEQVREGAFAGPVARVGRVLADEDGCGLDPAGLVVAGDHAVVPDERVGEKQDLTAVRGVGDGLLVADHARREDDLAGDLAPSGEAPALEGRPVFEDQRGFASPVAMHVLQTSLQSCRVPAVRQL